MRRASRTTSPVETSSNSRILPGEHLPCAGRTGSQLQAPSLQPPTSMAVSRTRGCKTLRNVPRSNINRSEDAGSCFPGALASTLAKRLSPCRHDRQMKLLPYRRLQKNRSSFAQIAKLAGWCRTLRRGPLADLQPSSPIRPAGSGICRFGSCPNSAEPECHRASARNESLRLPFVA
jgi:hypothetical protein